MRAAVEPETDDDVADEAEGACLTALVAHGRGVGFLNCHVRKIAVCVVAAAVQRGNRFLRVTMQRNQSSMNRI